MHGKHLGDPREFEFPHDLGLGSSEGEVAAAQSAPLDPLEEGGETRGVEQIDAAAADLRNR